MSDDPNKLTVDYDELLEVTRSAFEGLAKTMLWAGLSFNDVLRVARLLGRVGGALNPTFLKSLLASGELTEDDAENVGRIIRAGKESGVDEVEIEMNREEYIGLQGKNLGGEGVNVAFGKGGSTGYKINVKYK